MENGKLKMSNDPQAANGPGQENRLRPGRVRTEKVPIYTIMIQKAPSRKDSVPELLTERGWHIVGANQEGLQREKRPNVT
jgi:hypothetical protein